jgi:hypothetical protein
MVPTKIQVQSASNRIGTLTRFIRMNWAGSGCKASNSSGVLTINCSGGSGSLSTSVAAVSDLASNVVSRFPAYQTTPFFDVRTFGVIGNGTTDDTVAMQNAINAACKSGGRGVRILAWNSVTNKPLSMLVSSTIDFTKCLGVFFDGGSSQGEATENTSGFIWDGAAGGTVLLVNQTRDSTFQNFFIDTQTSAGHNNANVGLDIDEDSTVTTITTNNVYRNILVRSHDSNSNLVGIRVAHNAPANVERQIFDHLTVDCSDNRATSSNNGIGWQLGPGGEPYWVELHDYDSGNCSRGIDIEIANILKIDGGLASGNYTDLYYNGGRGVTYSHIRSESGIAQIVLGAHPGELTTDHLSFSGLTAGTCTYTYSSPSLGVPLRVFSNDWDNVAVTPICGPTFGNSATLDSRDNNYPNGTCPTFTQFQLGASSINEGCGAQSIFYGGSYGSPAVSIFGNQTLSGHLNQNVANTWAGTCTMTSGACTAIKFGTAYTTAVACQVSWTGTGKLTGTLSSNRTTRGLQPKSSVVTDTAQVDWFCAGNPN